MTAVWWKQPYHFTRRFLARWWLKFHPQVTVIGVTGSYGKTNTTRAIAQVLQEKFKVLQTDLNLDTNYNLPITLLKLRDQQKLVLEYGVDHRGEMTSHLSLARPKIAVITGINPTHSETELLGSIKGIIAEKSKMLKTLTPNDLAILNWDDPQVRLMVKNIKAKVISYGLKPGADFQADQIKVDFKGTSFRLNMTPRRSPSDTVRGVIQIKTGLVGQHFVQACLAAAAIGINQGLNWPEIKSGLTKLKSLSGRLSIEKGPFGSILLNDALRANPASTLAGLQTLADLPAKGKRVAVLGEMGELGKMAQKEHRRIGQTVKKLKIDYLIGVGPLQSLTVQASGLPKNKAFRADNVQEAAAILKKILKKNDLLYLKGSLLRHMERVVLILKGQKVCCQAVFCHHYHQCSDCPDLQKTS